MVKLFCAMAITALTVFTGGHASSTKAASTSVNPASRANDPICYHNTSTAAIVAVETAAAQAQEGSKHCERPSKNNPDVGEKDPDKLGCMCAYKCVNGEPQEDNSDSNKMCKNFCKKDQCECKKPSCKT